MNAAAVVGVVSGVAVVEGGAVIVAVAAAADSKLLRKGLRYF